MNILSRSERQNCKIPVQLRQKSVKDSFFKNTAYLFRDMPCFAFVSINAVLVRKNDTSQINKKGSLV